jgi:hypothetical protein
MGLSVGRFHPQAFAEFRSAKSWLDSAVLSGGWNPLEGFLNYSDYPGPILMFGSGTLLLT